MTDREKIEAFLIAACQRTIGPQSDNWIRADEAAFVVERLIRDAAERAWARALDDEQWAKATPLPADFPLVAEPKEQRK